MSAVTLTTAYTDFQVNVYSIMSQYFTQCLLSFVSFNFPLPVAVVHRVIALDVLAAIDLIVVMNWKGGV